MNDDMLDEIAYMNSLNSARNSIGGAGMATQNIGVGLATTGISSWVGRSSMDIDWNVSINKAENGFIVRFGQSGGYVGKTYVCSTPQEVSERILTCMVEGKLEK